MITTLTPLAFFTSAAMQNGTPHVGFDNLTDEIYILRLACNVPSLVYTWYLVSHIPAHTWKGRGSRPLGNPSQHPRRKTKKKRVTSYGYE